MSDMSMQAADVPRESILSTVKLIREEISQSHDRFSSLADRISPVVRPKPESANKQQIESGINTNPNQSDLLSMLQDIGNEIYRLNNRLSNLSANIEL
jgi:hypothetical protein